MPRGSEAHRRAESDHLDTGARLPLVHRAAWQEAQPRIASVAVQVWNRSTRRSQALFCADRVPSRLFRGFHILRVERFGGFADEEAARAAVAGLADLATRESRVVRTRIELYSLDSRELGLVADLLAAHGFVRSAEPRCYQRTALLDLRRTLDEVFAGLHGTARRHVRAVAKNPVEVREVGDPTLAVRMSELLSHTFARTGSVPEERDWGALVRFSLDHPSLSRVVGLFRADETGPEALLAFVWGANHGSTVEYVSGASTRVPDLKMPLSYGLMWSLIEWAHVHGADYFDFGGISAGSHGVGDPVGGISDFKRYFKPQVQTVGDEWVRAESRTLHAAARVVGGLRGLVRSGGR